MNTLYRKVLFSERLPNDNNYHDTDKGKIYCWKGVLCNQSGVLKFTPDWWLEEVNIPADEDMNKVAIEKTSTRGEYLNYLDGAKWERSRNKWISVEDELPPLSHYFDSLSQSVMTCDNHCVLGIGYYNFAFKCWFAGGCSAIVTHWQSLPEAPKQMD